MKDLIKKILREEIENDYTWFDEYYSDHKDPLEPVKEFIFNKMKDCGLVIITEDNYPTLYEDYANYTIYIDNDTNDILFVDDTQTKRQDLKFLWVDRDKIWKKVIDRKLCEVHEFQKICQKMVKDIYNRKVAFVTTYDLGQLFKNLN